MVMVDTEYNPFIEKKSPGANKELDRMYAEINSGAHALVDTKPLALSPRWNDELVSESDEFVFQLHNQYIITRLKTGILLIDQQAAHERILFERYRKMLEAGNGPSQQSLFPQVMELTAADYQVLKDILPDIRTLGFDLQEFGQNAFVIHGTPADVPAGDEKQMIEKLIEQFKNNQSRLNVDRREGIIRAMARSNSIKNGKHLSPKEMKQLIDELFACEKPFLGIEGKSTAVKMDLEDIREMFKK